MKNRIALQGGFPSIILVVALLCAAEALQAQVVTNDQNGCSVTINTPPNVSVPLPNSCAGDCTTSGFGGATYGVTINQPTTTANAPCGVIQVTVDYNNPTLHPPPDFACLLPSCRTIESTITVDTPNDGKVVIVAQNQLCVLQHMHVIYDGGSFHDENTDDNSNPDGSDNPGTTLPDKVANNPGMIINQFIPGATLEVQNKLFDCDGNKLDETHGLCALYNARFTVAEYMTTVNNTNYMTGDVLITNIVGVAGSPDSGQLMACDGDNFKYKFSTKGYEVGTRTNSHFFRIVTKIEANGQPGVVVSQEDVILESK